jgi:8-oxo-dGTP diphosphatase
MENSEELSYYFRAAFSGSVVIFGLDEGHIKVLLVKRPKDPFKGLYALPAVLVYPNDSIEEKVDSLIQKVTGTNFFYKKQIRAFADTSRHPLGRVISIGYYSFVNLQNCKQFNDSEDGASEWVDLKQIPKLAFDHNEIVQAANRRLLAKMSSQLAGFEMLPETFTLKQVQEMYEATLGHTLDKRNFRRKILAQSVIQETGKFHSPWEESGKAPMLYRLNRAEYLAKKEAGHKFEIF